ncbi:MAG: hypothetical protein MZU95_17365 [Desulfomicrobium escambiense]|nr:hypothetical protein [Desulfomicrobium escambiense]
MSVSALPAYQRIPVYNESRITHGFIWNAFVTNQFENPGTKRSIVFTVRDITERKKAEEKLQQTLESLRKAVGTTIQVLVSAVESRDSYTAGHQSRSADLACAIATEMGLAPGENRRNPHGRYHP